MNDLKPHACVSCGFVGFCIAMSRIPTLTGFRTGWVCLHCQRRSRIRSGGNISRTVYKSDPDKKGKERV
jgi:hypothetical protein